MLPMIAHKRRIGSFGRMPNNVQCHNPTSHINISDVIAVLEATDPYYTNTLENNDTKEQKQRSISPMYSPAGAQQVAQVAPQPSSKFHRPTAYVKITEQPASKSLRFRYECEGRSAGSIPGVNSTPENKTFPEIQIIGYHGPAVVVVSCVTKDAPYRAHPHNLVGREGCKKGVCTLQVPQDTMRVQFSNLGIQCVKRKEIDQSLINRQQIRVDPFKQGFKHIGQTTSIDLNAVRLCFQVFIVDPNTNKCTVPLQPVVSDIIFDKKSMMELKITKLSDSYSFVDGGRKDMIVLCEKVDKQDIAVKFFELDEKKQVVWEAMADLQPNQVWKQTAIWFKTPAYQTLDVKQPIKCFIQLYRPSDEATGEARSFELLPRDTGTPSWPSKRKKANYKQVDETYETIEANNIEKTVRKSSVTVEDMINDNDLINQVAELDEIYSNSHVTQSIETDILATQTRTDSFDDAKTYSSLQLAFKNPVELSENYLIEKVVKPALEPPPRPPPLSVKSDIINSIHVLPPLPPKRTKKLETYIGGSVTSIPLSGKQAENLLTRSNSGSMKSQPVSRTQSFNSQRPKSQIELDPSYKSLPPIPNASATLPNPKKRSFFSKIFKRKSKTPGTSREPSVAPSVRSSKSLQVGNVLGKSSGNISTHSTNSIRIPLKDSPTSSQQNISFVIPSAPNMNDDIDMQLDLTEAENYALYTAIAPHATQSEFDEFSCYYAPVEGGKLLSKAEVVARFSSRIQ